MAIDRDFNRIFQKTRSAWTDINAEMQRLNSSCAITPGAFEEIFQPSASDFGKKICVNPIIINIPERVGGTLDLYIVVEGWITFDIAERDLFSTKDFSTRVGYFRIKADGLHHDFGAHYDIDSSNPSHPVFHSQIAPHTDSFEKIRHLTHLNIAVDNVSKILRNVRIPSAQMDIFSVILQLCADHLINQDSDADQLKAFTKIKAACNFFSGAGKNYMFLDNSDASACYRSFHWYPVQ